MHAKFITKPYLIPELCNKKKINLKFSDIKVGKMVHCFVASNYGVNGEGIFRRAKRLVTQTSSSAQQPSSGGSEVPQELRPWARRSRGPIALQGRGGHGAALRSREETPWHRVASSHDANGVVLLAELVGVTLRAGARAGSSLGSSLGTVACPE